MTRDQSPSTRDYGRPINRYVALISGLKDEMPQLSVLIRQSKDSFVPLGSL